MTLTVSGRSYWLFNETDRVGAGEGTAHMNELSKLAEKDPEFYKYLQENDRELLDFDPGALQEEDEGEDEEMAEEKTPVLTKDILQKWQKALLKVRWPARVL